MGLAISAALLPPSSSSSSSHRVSFCAAPFFPRSQVRGHALHRRPHLKKHTHRDHHHNVSVGLSHLQWAVHHPTSFFGQSTKVRKREVKRSLRYFSSFAVASRLHIVSSLAVLFPPAVPSLLSPLLGKSDTLSLSLLLFLFDFEGGGIFSFKSHTLQQLEIPPPSLSPLALFLKLPIPSIRLYLQEKV